MTAYLCAGTAGRRGHGGRQWCGSTSGPNCSGVGRKGRCSHDRAPGAPTRRRGTPGARCGSGRRLSPRASTVRSGMTTSGARLRRDALERMLKTGENRGEISNIAHIGFAAGNHRHVAALFSMVGRGLPLTIELSGFESLTQFISGQRRVVIDTDRISGRRGATEIDGDDQGVG